MEQSTHTFETGVESELGFPGNGDLLPGAPQHGTLRRLQLLWSGRRSILKTTAAGVICFALLAFIIPSTYESSTRLMPPDSKSEGMTMLAALTSKSGDSGLGDLATDMLGIKSSGALFVGVLRSRTVEDALIQRFDLRKVYSRRRWEDTRKKLEGRTAITEDRKSGIIEIRVQDRSPQRAQALAQAYVDELDRAVNKLSTSAARREREFLETRLVDVKRDLDAASKEFSEFSSQNTAIDIPAQGRAMVEATAVLQGQLIAAESEKQGLEQIYTANNVRVRALEGRIAELKRQLEKAGSAGTGNDTQSDTDSSDTFPSLRKLPLLGVRYFDLYRQAKIQEALFETLTKRYEMAKVQEAKEIPSVRVLDPGNLPEKPTGLSRTAILALGLVLSFAAGCAWILGDAEWQAMDPHDPTKIFVLDLLRDAHEDWSRSRAAGLRLLSKVKRDNHTDTGLDEV